MNKTIIHIFAAILAVAMIATIVALAIGLNNATAPIVNALPDKTYLDDDFTTVMNAGGLVVKQAAHDGEKRILIANYSATEYTIIGKVENSTQCFVEHIKPNEYKVYTVYDVFNGDFECRIDFLTKDCKGVPPYIVGIFADDVVVCEQ